MNNKRKTTKRNLISSVISLILCVSMFIGTTFAWFTDSVSSGRNQIVAGNLDVELEYTTDFVNWYSVQDVTELIDPNALWEPGHAEVVYLRIRNVGTLALKYQLFANIYNEVGGTNVNGDTFKLSDYIKIGAVEVTGKFASREDSIAAVSSVAVDLNGGYEAKTGSILQNADPMVLALVAYMPTSVDNSANYLTGTTAPSIDIGLILQATQYTVEEDSFDKMYDKDAVYPLDLKADETSIQLSEVKAPEATVTISEVDDNGNYTKTTAYQAATKVETVTSDNTVINTVTTYKDVTITASNDNVKVTIPKSVSEANQATGYNLKVEPNTDIPGTITVQSGEVAANYEISLTDQNGNAVTSLEQDITVELNVGTGLWSITPYHNGKVIDSDKYSYNSETGILKIYTNSFSPYTVVSKNQFTAGSGTQEDPYIISNVTELTTGIEQTRILTSNAATYYQLACDVSVDQAIVYSDPWGDPESAGIIRLYNAFFDLNGNTISAPKDTHLFGDVRNSSISNGTVELDGQPMTYFEMNSEFDGMKVTGYAELANNQGGFLDYSYFDFTMKNCEMAAKLTANGGWGNYNAVFMGYPVTEDTLTFENCKNTGSLVCGTASMFVGNLSYRKATLNIIDCKNEGTIQATYQGNDYTFNVIASVTSDGQHSLATVNVNGTRYKGSAAVNGIPFEIFGGTFINGPQDSTLALARNEDGTFTITPATTEGVVRYKVSVGNYGKIIKGGTIQVSVSEIIEAGSESLCTTLKDLSFVDQAWLDANTNAVKSTLAGNTVYILNGVMYYLMPADLGLYTYDGTPKASSLYSVSAYDASGNLLASAGLSN